MFGDGTFAPTEQQYVAVALLPLFLVRLGNDLPVSIEELPQIVEKSAIDVAQSSISAIVSRRLISFPPDTFSTI